MADKLGARVQEWFFGAGRACVSASELLHGLCMVLRASGMPVQRANLLVRTRQPQLEMLVYIWRASDSDRVVVDTTQAVVGVRRDRFEGGEVETVLLAMGHADEATWLDSPFHACLVQGAPLRRRLIEPETPRDFPILLRPLPARDDRLPRHARGSPRAVSRRAQCHDRRCRGLHLPGA